MAPNPLPVVPPCEGCGACCRWVTRPPFYRAFGGAGEDAWERLKHDRPDLAARVLDDERTRKAAGGPFYGTPCLWYDAEARRCGHYDYRPRVCREFHAGDPECHDLRRRAGLP